MIMDEQQEALTVLQKANLAFNTGDFEGAIALYQQAANKIPPLASSLEFNISLAQLRFAAGGETISGALPLVVENSTHPAPVLKVIQKLFTADNLAVAVNLQPLDNNSWQSTNDDPHFYLDIADKVLAAGFYQLALQLNTDKALSKASAKLYCDYGNGFNEQDTIVFCVPFNKAASRIVWLGQPVKALRFDPLEVALEFKLEAFELTSVCETSALAYMENSLLDKNIVLPEPAEDYQHNLYQLYDSMIKDGFNNVSYEEWIQLKELPSLPDNSTVAKHITGFTHKPVFSVVMPTYNTDEVYLRECIDSVLNQSYPYLELCIADDNSPKPHVLKVLNEYAAKDKRVKVVARKQNGHISRATNSAIDVATGDFIALLDHDDLLAQHALYFMAEAINANPDGQIFYSDEDKLDLQGRRTNPHFKSDWNPDLFFSQNYVSHLGVYKASLIKKIGGFRTGVEGSQDQDLLLRCLPHVKHNQIHHIPRVLYHWRMLEGSTALASGEKSYTTEAGIKALQDYFSENGPAGVEVEAGLVPNTYKVNWPLPAKLPKVSLLIPTRDRKTITEVAVRSILEKTTYPNYEIVILDNGSVEPETLSFFKQIQQEDKRVSVLRYDYPFNYSAINNYGVKHTSGELVGLINNDIEVINPEWLTEMVSHAIRPDIGCVGAKLYYPNGRIQHAGVILGIGGVASHGFKMFRGEADGYFSRLKVIQNYSAVTAACLLIKRSLYDKVEGLNEQDLRVGYNDVDFCLKVAAEGYRNLWTPYAELVHHESISRGDDLSPEKQERLKNEREYMLANWGAMLDNDLYYSPNLTKNADDFGLMVHSSSIIDFSNNIIYSWDKPDRANNKKYACVFVGYDAKSVLHAYVIYYLECLSKYFDIYFVTTAERIHEDECQIVRLKKLCKSVVVRKNVGYDFGSWCYGINSYKDELVEYDGVLLNNDSVYGPLYDLKEFITVFETSDVDVLGMTDSNELDYHLQSYFIMYSQEVFRSKAFAEMWKCVKSHTDKWDIIKKYEIGFSQRLMRYAGYKLKAFCDMAGYPNLNHTHVHWRDLICKKRFPFIKAELVKKNPFNVDISDIENIVNLVSDFDVNLIKPDFRA